MQISETLFGAIVGYAAGFLPTIVTLVVDIWKMLRQERYQTHLRHIELVEEQRMKALRAFSEQFGAFINTYTSGDFSVNTYLAAMNQAAMFVEDETLKAMQAATPIILAGWPDWEGQEDILPPEKLKSPEILALTECLRREMRSTISDAFPDPPKCCFRPKHKRQKVA